MIHPQIYVGLKLKPKQVNLISIFEMVCEKLKVHPKEVKGRTRFEEIVRARIVYSILALNSGYNLREVGTLINRHHASIIHYKEEFKYMKYNPRLEEDFNKCRV